MIKRKEKLKWRWSCGDEGEGRWRWRRLMTNNLTPTVGRGVKREEQQIQIININNRKDNNNTFNSSEINHILLSYYKVFSLDGVPVILLCRWLCQKNLSLSPAPMSRSSSSSSSLSVLMLLFLLLLIIVTTTVLRCTVIVAVFLAIVQYILIITAFVVIVSSLSRSPSPSS